MIKNEKGAALVMTLVVLVVMSILAVAFITVSASEYKFSVVEENKVKAYYVARSGADAVAAAIIDNEGGTGISVQDLAVGASLPAFEVVIPGMDDTAMVTVTRESADFINIEAVSTVGSVTGVSNKASLSLARTAGSEGVNLRDVFVVEDTDGDGYIYGDGLPRVIFDLEEDDFDEQKFSGGPITGDMTIKLIETKNNDTIEFVTNDEDITVYCRRIDNKGDITITGTGKVYIFVEEFADISTKTFIGADPTQLLIFVRDGAIINFQPNTTMYGFIYAPYAAVLNFQPNNILHGGIVGPYENKPGNVDLSPFVPGSSIVGVGEKDKYERFQWYE